MYSGIEGHDLDAVPSLDCLFEFCAEGKVFANVDFHAYGHAAAENYRFDPSRFIGNFDEFFSLRNSPHRVTGEPSILPFVGPAIQLYEQGITYTLPELYAGQTEPALNEIEQRDGLDVFSIVHLVRLVAAGKLEFDTKTSMARCVVTPEQRTINVAAQGKQCVVVEYFIKPRFCILEHENAF